ncbi:MAG: hypothetical protein AABW41_04010 [Nanoarchaeota archaeon]
MKYSDKDLFEVEENFFNEELMGFIDNEDNFEPMMELKPKKLRIKYKFCIAS